MSDERLAELIGKYCNAHMAALRGPPEWVAAYQAEMIDTTAALRELQSSRALLASQAEEIAGLKGENTCDVCGGTGEPTSGGPCMCAGTGKMSEAARQLLVECFDLRAKLAAAEKLLRELRVFFADRSNAAYAIDAATRQEGM